MRHIYRKHFPFIDISEVYQDTAAPPLVCATTLAGERCATRAPHAPKREIIASILAKPCPTCIQNGRMRHLNKPTYCQHISPKMEPTWRHNWYRNDGHFCITCLIDSGPCFWSDVGQFVTSWGTSLWKIGNFENACSHFWSIRNLAFDRILVNVWRHWGRRCEKCENLEMRAPCRREHHFWGSKDSKIEQ